MHKMEAEEKEASSSMQENISIQDKVHTETAV
jgi:hypothetical protein